MCALSELPEGTAISASFHGLPILVVRSNGALYAVSSVCTHEECDVDWNRSLDQLQCPCHDGRYALDGSVVSGPPPSPLMKLLVVVEDGDIYVEAP